jgi:zinc transport system substrate-binding protein
MLFCVISTISCSRLSKHDGLLIAVSIPPQAWFVSQIAGDHAQSVVLVGPGQNPHNYEPTPKQIQSLASANAWILSGTEFEISLLPKVASLFPKLHIVDGTEGVQFRLLAEYDDHDGANHSSLEIDRHTWLGREPAKILAGHIKDTLCRLDKKNAEFYTLQYESLIDLIEDEFESLRMTLAPLEGRSVFVYHPSFGYFLDEFGIHQEAVETGGKEPGPRVLNNLIAKVRQENAAAIFVQAQFPVNAAKTLADSVDAQIIILDPLAEDWLKNIQDMGQILQEAVLQRPQ